MKKKVKKIPSTSKTTNKVIWRAKCPICKKDFIYGHLKAHMKKDHQNAQNYKCKFHNCKFSAFYSVAVKKHYEKAHNKQDKPKNQNLNENQVTNKINENLSHELGNDPDIPNDPYEFKDDSESEQEIITKHNFKSKIVKEVRPRPRTISDDENVDSPSSPGSEDETDQVEDNPYSDGNTDQVDNNPGPTPAPEDADFKVDDDKGKKKCPICFRMVSLGSYFIYHVNLHKNLKYDCICNKSFRTSILLKQHKKYKCPHTHNLTESIHPKKEILKITNLKSGNKIDNWPHSHKLTERNRSKKGKLKITNLKSGCQIDNWYWKKVECPICKKEVFKFYLKDHIARHNNIKNYPCSYPNCSFSAFYSAVINKHFKEVHNINKLRNNFLKIGKNYKNLENKQETGHGHVVNPEKNKPDPPEENNDTNRNKTDDDKKESVPKPTMNAQNADFNINSEERSKVKLKVRIKRGEKVKCQICLMEMQHSNLKDHIAKHRNIKNYFCQKYKFSTFYRSVIYRHYKLIHKCKFQHGPIVGSKADKSQLDNFNLEDNSKITKSGNKLSKCPICNKMFSTLLLEDHISKHKKIKNWFCKICKYSTFYYLGLCRHYKNEHPGETFNKKSSPQKIKPKISKKSRKIKRRKKYPYFKKRRFRKCKICQKMIGGSLNYKHHILSHKNEGDDNKCDICTFSSIWNASLVRHKRVVHGINPKMTEEENKGNYQNTQAQDNPPVTIEPKSNILAQKVKIPGPSRIVNLNTNLQIDSNLRQLFACLICKETFTAFDSLKIHLKIHLNEPGPKINKRLDVSEEKISQIMNCLINCDKCKKVLVQHGKYLEKVSEDTESQQNKNKIGKIPGNSSDENAKEAATEKCSRPPKVQFNNSSQNQINLKNSTNCKQKLSESVKNSKEVQKSINISELKKSRSCTFCSRLFSSRSDLNKHKLAIHQDKFKFSCKLCSLKLQTEQKLKVHVFQIHRKNIQNLLIIN